MLKVPSWFKAFSLLLALLVSSCGGGSTASPPTGGLTVTPGGGRVTISWTATPGVSYWLLYSATSSAIDMQNPPASHTWVTPVTSPYVVTGLTNGTTYAFAINGRIGGGAGGAQTPTAWAMPRPAGSGSTINTSLSAVWATASGTAPSASANFSSVMYGTDSSSVADYMAVANGSIYYSTDAQSWTLDSAASSQNYTASLYYAGVSRFLAASATGSYMYYSTVPGSWTASNGITTPIYGVAASSSRAVAVGASGRAYYSADGIAWTLATINGTAPTTIYGVTYSSTYGFVAVGTGGRYMISSDGITWTAYAMGAVTADLRAITNYSGTLVAVGTGGVVASSTNSTSWTSTALTGTPTLYAVTTDGVQYVTVGSAGTVFTSPDASTWTSQTANSDTVNDLLGIYGTQVSYVAVGANGTIVTAK